MFDTIHKVCSLPSFALERVKNPHFQDLSQGSRGRRYYSYKKLSKVPQKSAVYFALGWGDRTAEILYIGQTINLRRRWLAHDLIWILDLYDRVDERFLMSH